MAGGVLAALLTCLAAVTAAQAQATQWTAASYTARLVELVNQARHQNGLAPLSVASGTTEVAAAWTARLDAAGSLSHDPDLRHQLETHGSPDWMTYGENVGQGPGDNPDALFQAYMHSSEHRANILNSAYRFTGVAVVLDGSAAWNTFDFVDTYHSGKPAGTSQPTPAARPGAGTASKAPVPRTAAPGSATSTAVSGPAATQPAAVAHPPREVRRPARAAAARMLPHTGRRATAVDLPDVARLLAGGAVGAAGGPGGQVVASPGTLPAPLPLPAELAYAIAGLSIGFVAMRWAQLVRAA